jgi:hypothetical protein
MLWARSFWCFDEIGWEVHDAIVAFGSSHGTMLVGFGTDYPSSAKQGWHVGRPGRIRLEHGFAGFGYRNKLIGKTYHVRAIAFPIWLPMLLLAWPAVIFVRGTIRHSGPNHFGFEVHQPSLFSGRPST